MYRKLSFILSFISVIFISTTLKAQDRPIDLLPPELIKEVNNDLSSVIEGLVIFGSSSALGSGYFTFDADGSPDTKLDTLRLFNSYSLSNDDKATFKPFINFGIGHAKLTEQIPPVEGVGLNDFSRTTSLNVGLGLGADIALADNFYLTPVFDVTYTKTENNYDYNNEFSQVIIQLFDKDIFNWDVETMSYNPGAKLRYELTSDSIKLVPSVSYTQMYVDSISTNSSIIDVTRTSGILNSRLRLEIDDVLCLAGSPLTIVPQVSRIDLYKDARSGIGIGYFHEFSLALLAKKQEFLPLFKEVGVSGGYTVGDNVDGWRVGLEGSF